MELTDALNEEKQRSLSQAQTISELTSQRSILTSKTQEQQSIIAALRTEISEAQNINKSLQKDNQSLIRQNDDLRFDHGVESLKEVDDLRDEICRLHLKIAELNKQVDHSTVAAVNKAYKKLEENDQKAKKKMQDFRVYANKKIREYVDEIEKRNGIIKSQHARIRSEKNKLWLYRDLLFLYCLCTLAVTPVILQDIGKLFTTAGLLLEEYYEWILCPCYYPYPGAAPQPYETGISWAIRISLSLLIIVSVLGSVIKEYLRWNTAVLLFFLFLLEMRFLLRFENMFTKNHKTDEWERIKDQNDKSYFVTFHIYTCFHEMIWNRNITNI